MSMDRSPEEKNIMMSRLLIVTFLTTSFLLISANYSVSSITDEKPISFCVQNQINFEAIKNEGYKITGPVELISVNQSQIIIYIHEKRETIALNGRALQIIDESCNNILIKEMDNDRPKIYFADTADKVLLIILSKENEAY